MGSAKEERIEETTDDAILIEQDREAHGNPSGAEESENSAAPNVPADMVDFQFSAMEDAIRKLIRENDKWIYQ